MNEVQKAPESEYTPEVITPERHNLIKELQKQFPHLDYGTFVLLTRLSEDDLKEIFPPEDEAPEGYYELKHPKVLKN